MSRGICTVCQRFFNKDHISQVKCRECYNRDEADYEKVRVYLGHRPGATVSDVMKDTGVSMKTLDRFIGEKRVYIVDNKFVCD